jgi:auxin efflux carrier family protein
MNCFILQLGGLFIWTHTYSLMQKSGKLYHKMQSQQCPDDSDEEHSGQDEEPAKQHGAAASSTDEEAPLLTSLKSGEDREENQMVCSG